MRVAVVDRIETTRFHYPLAGEPRRNRQCSIKYRQECRLMAVRPEGADHQWRKIPPRELSIDLVADERFGRATGRAGAS